MTPDFVVCIECETPCYVFEWSGGTISEAVCEACGNDDPELFATPEDFDMMMEG